MWPVTTIPVAGHTVSMETAATATAITGITTTLLQKATQAPGIDAFSSPQQPSHLLGIGVSADIAKSTLADMMLISPAWTGCITSPVLITRVNNTANSRRIFPDRMRLTITIYGAEYQGCRISTAIVS